MNILDLFRRKPEPLPLPRSVTAKRTLNLSAYNSFLNIFREHQTKSFNACLDAKIGQISLPTGTGKTYVQMAVHIQDMISKSQNGESGVYVISAHRILLCTQLRQQLQNHLTDIGIEYDWVSLNSSKEDPIEDIQRQKDRPNVSDNAYALNKHTIAGVSTTSSDEVLDAYNKAKANKRHLLIVCTYHSFDRMSKLPKIDIITYDEAHQIENDQFKNNVGKIKHLIEREFFFTATRRIAGDTGGMNDPEFYGEVLYSESPRTMIERGEIVRPVIHAIKLPEEARGDFQNTSMVVQSVGEGFIRHHEMVKEHSKNPDMIGAKIVVSTLGNDDLTDIVTNVAFQDWSKRNEIEVFSFSSDKGYFHNFEPLNRKQAFENMQNLTSQQNAILLHIDILSEGIDIPSITGFMPLRNVSDIKLTQSIGRAGRLHPFDRQRLYDNIITPDQLEEFVKPCYYVILPEFLVRADTRKMEKFIGDMLNTYDLKPFELPYIDEFYSTPDEILPKVTDADSTRNRDDVSKLEHILRTIMKEQIVVALNDASDGEILEYLEGIGNA
jgi:superfamily II DNA or RNA helicase